MINFVLKNREYYQSQEQSITCITDHLHTFKWYIQSALLGIEYKLINAGVQTLHSMQKYRLSSAVKFILKYEVLSQAIQELN
jgi:hypothetical protein